MKMKNFDKEKKESKLVNVESPRFVSTLRRALECMFQQVDADKSGKLSYQEFRDAFKTLSYGLNDNDVKMLISMADEDKDEKIDWKEFLDIGIKMIKTIYSRNIAKKNHEHSHVDKSLEVIFNDEIKRTTKLLNYKFRSADKAKNGRVSLEEFKRIIRETRFLTPKEKNLIIRL